MSSILSDMSDPSPLSYPDYDQLSSDHRRVLILIKSLGPGLHSGAVKRLTDHLQSVTRFQLEDEALSPAHTVRSLSLIHI